MWGFWPAICMSLGCSLLQPAHHAAKKLTTTGWDKEVTACLSSAALLQFWTLCGVRLSHLTEP